MGARGCTRGAEDGLQGGLTLGLGMDGGPIPDIGPTPAADP